MMIRTRKLSRSINSSTGRKYIGDMEEISFDSIGELLAETKRPFFGRACRTDWLGCDDFDQLDGYVENGWVEMEERMNKMLNQITPPPAELRPEINRRRRRVKRDFGNEVDIHAIYQGRMDRAWDATVVEEVKTVGNKLVHININLSASCGVRFNDGLWRGAVAMRVYDVLMRMGKSIAISGYYAANGAFQNGTHGMVSCRLKHYGEPLRPDRLAGMVTLGFMRHHLMHRGLNAHGRTPDLGRGYPIDDYQLLTYAAEKDVDSGGAVVTIGQCFDLKQAQAVVDKFIRQYTRDEKIEGLSAFELTKSFKSSEVPHHE